MVAPADREFALAALGDKREEILESWRIGLRQMTNPATGLAFTEDEIATATAVGSRYWIEANAIDLLLLAEQNRALWLADQVRIERASSEWLHGYHGEMWGETLLEATGGSGPVTIGAVAGTVWVGSTTIPDQVAHYFTDPAGLRYQVKTTVVTPGSGVATLTLVGIDTGKQTNIAAGTKLQAANPPVNGQTEATTSQSFTGGTDRETDAEFARRLKARIRRKPASGNAAHFRGWAREASNAVEDAFVYPCFLHAGSVLVAVAQKRSGASGPTARIANATTLDAVKAYVVPRNSPVVPARAHVVVVPPVAQTSNVVLTLAMAKGLSSGWADPTPWPGIVGTSPTTITTVTTQTSIKITIPAGSPALPSGVTAPKLMVWNDATSRFEQLQVASVVLDAGEVYSVTLSSAPTKTLAVGDYVSPHTSKLTIVAETLEAYFDELGPGEVIDLATDDRAHRAFRFPEPHEEAPARAGAAVTTRLADALGVALADAQLVAMSVTTPDIPSTPILGPSLLTLGRAAIYAS